MQKLARGGSEPLILAGCISRLVATHRVCKSIIEFHLRIVACTLVHLELVFRLQSPYKNSTVNGMPRWVCLCLPCHLYSDLLCWRCLLYKFRTSEVFSRQCHRHYRAYPTAIVTLGIMKLNLIAFFLFIFSFAAASPVAEPDEVDGLEGLYERDSSPEHFQHDHKCNQQESRCEPGHWNSNSCKCNGKCAMARTAIASPVTGTGIAVAARASGVVITTPTATTGAGTSANARKSATKLTAIASPVTGTGIAVAARASGVVITTPTATTGAGTSANARKSATKLTAIASPAIGTGIAVAARAGGVVITTLTAKRGTGINASVRRSAIKQILTANHRTGIGTIVAVEANGATTSSLIATTGIGIIAGASTTSPRDVLRCFKHLKLT
ncbi:hypothetical protein AFLA_013683 [Aspergillus flavus NRRL3357]|nr:hypothetical protein AFLA_013683 [Aspergillus flavus NRRL3357]